MKTQTKFILLILLSLFLALILYKTNQTKNVSTEVYTHIEHLGLADTPEKMTQGLMWRRDLCDNCGMLFVFAPNSQVNMWMKNTPTSLDMIFMDKDGVIVAIHPNTVPFQEFPTYSSAQKVTYVLEMKAGFADRERLKTGMKFDVNRLTKMTSLIKP